MMRIVLIVLLTFLLTACPSGPERLYFDTDPRILRGLWVGEVLPTPKVYRLATVSTNGRELFALRDNALVRLNPDSGEEIESREIKLLPAHNMLKVYPDGEIWAYGRESGLQIQRPDGTVLPPWEIWVRAISADRSRVLARLSDNHYGVYEVTTRQLLRDFTLPQNFSFDMFGDNPPRIDAVSPDLQRLASGWVFRDGLSVRAEVKLYDLDLNVLRTWVIGRGVFDTGPFGHPELSFSPDGSHLIGLMPDGRAFFWRLSDGAAQSPDYPDRSHTLIAESPDGRSRVFLRKSDSTAWDVEKPASCYELVWWEAGRGVWARQTVHDVLGCHQAHAAAQNGRVWLFSGTGLMAVLEPSGLRWRKEPTLVPLRLELTPTYRDERSYTFVGTAKHGDTAYSVTGKGFTPYGALITQAPPPPYLAFIASLESGSSPPRYMAGLIDLGSSAPKPIYPISLSSQPYTDRYPLDRGGQLDGWGYLRRAEKSH